MNPMLCLYPEQFDTHNIIINKKIKNNIIEDSYFYRLIYSDDLFQSNGLFVLFTFTNIKIEHYYNKIKCNFEDNHKNNKNIEIIKNIENDILNKLHNVEHKILSTKLKDQLNNYNIKLFEDKNTPIKNFNSINIILKISGIWSTSSEIGVTFKFYIYN